ncbi:hypothetical protein COBT_000386, partial [Conglomerata obtusa]
MQKEQQNLDSAIKHKSIIYILPGLSFGKVAISLLVFFSTAMCSNDFPRASYSYFTTESHDGQINDAYSLQNLNTANDILFRQTNIAPEITSNRNPHNLVRKNLLDAERNISRSIKKSRHFSDHRKTKIMHQLGGLSGTGICVKDTKTVQNKGTNKDFEQGDQTFFPLYPETMACELDQNDTGLLFSENANANKVERSTNFQLPIILRQNDQNITTSNEITPAINFSAPSTSGYMVEGEFRQSNLYDNVVYETNGYQNTMQTYDLQQIYNIKPNEFTMTNDSIHGDNRNVRLMQGTTSTS